MKKFLLLICFAVLCVFINSTAVFAGQVDILIEKLVQKGILTNSEAKQMVKEIDREEKAAKKAAPYAYELPDWINSVKFKGDLRLRHDTQWRETEDDKYSRNRERFRLRLGADVKITETTKVGIRLASGSGYQNTTNQSFDGHSRGKNIFIDRAYAQWKPYDFFKIVAGKHKNPLFKSSLVWDSDVNPEGLSEHFNYKISDNVKLFATFGQWMLEELNIKDSDRDPMIFVCQLGTTLMPADNIKFEIAGTYYKFDNLEELEWKSGGLSDKEEFLGYNHKHSQQMVFDSDGKLLNEFECFEIGAKLSFKNFLPVPFTIFGDYIVNNEADVDDLVENGTNPGDSDPAKLLAYDGDDRDTGWQVGFSFGNKKKKGDWYAKYFYQELEDYAFPAVFVDSDFHGGGTNNKGHCIQGRYFLMDNIQARATGFFTEREEEDKDGKKDEDRLQVDMIITF